MPPSIMALKLFSRFCSLQVVIAVGRVDFVQVGRKLSEKRRHESNSADRKSADPWTTWMGVPTGKLP
ncbi:MAG: hypothetical protein Q7J85_15165 [Bacillota bacterium]|nr:hypothetical protein [Bacillota bacterium]